MSDCCNTPVSFEAKLAMKDAQCVINMYGTSISVLLSDEGDVDRDRYNSIKRRTPNTSPSLKAYPVIFSPTMKEKDKVGLRELTEIIATTATQDWIDLGFDMEMLNEIDSIRALVTYRGTTYEIKDKALRSQIGDSFLYVVLGLNRK